MNDDGPPRTLDVSTLIYLARIGDLIRDAPDHEQRHEAITLGLSVAKRYRAMSLTWPDIARAMRVAQSDLLDWLAATTPKPPAGLPEPAPSSLPAPPPPFGPSATVSQSILQSQAAAQSIQATATSTQQATSRYEYVEERPHRRCVVALSGDPRPGGNLFGPEIAAIRDALPADVAVPECACVGLTELGPLLERHRPVILHLAAHHGHGGVALASDGRTLWTRPETFARQILMAPVRPKLVVLNGCDSARMAGHLDVPLLSVISWDSRISDEHGRHFAELLYGALGRSIPLRAAFDAAADAIVERWPSLRPRIARPSPRALF